MNVLIIGGGGREHALGWKLKQSKGCGRLYFAPGNGGTASLGENRPELTVNEVDTKTVDAIDYFCRHQKVEFIVVGPEDPLAAGLVDRLQGRGRIVFGPGRSAAQLEADKAFAKRMMRAASVPTAEHRTFTTFDAAEAYIRSHEGGLVVKAAGLAAGKGVFVCDDPDEAVAAAERLLTAGAMGHAGKTILVEELLKGQEVSVLALVDGLNLYVLEPAQDHKQLGEGDTGPNTGGMGAYSPTTVVGDKEIVEIQRQVLVPIVDAMRRSETEFRGVLYAGLMMTPGGPKVLEFNVRFGDPECQALMMRLKGNLLDILRATMEGRLDQVDLSWDPRVCCCTVLASEGYPGAYRKGVVIDGITAAESDPDVRVFHAGTTWSGEQLVTAGGRVLSVCAMGRDLAEAQGKANAACEKISFEGKVYRRDIGHRVIKSEA